MSYLKGISKDIVTIVKILSGVNRKNYKNSFLIANSK